MKFFSVVTVFVLGFLALANAVPLSPDHDVRCHHCNVDNRQFPKLKQSTMKMGNMELQTWEPVAEEKPEQWGDWGWR